MKGLRAVYHIARADFLERVRRYSFLLMVGLVLWIGYLSASGVIRMRVPPDHIGIINSAWVGATMTVTVSLILGWVGFYLVKGSVDRDYRTGVGQIMATTPLSRPLYMLGKWLSNFAVLALAVLLLLLEGLLMNLVTGMQDFNLPALAAPLVIIALPAVALIAALAVLFESVRWLRGGLGNIVYFFAFLFAFITSAELSNLGTPGHIANPYIDFAGWQIIGDSVSRAAQAAYPESAAAFAFSITSLPAPKLFLWEGVQWTGAIFLSRLLFVLIAVALVLLAAALFDRFNPAQALPAPAKKTRRPWSAPDPAGPEPTGPAPASTTAVQLTPLAASRARFRGDALIVAELKLLLKGQPWWWYAVAAGLVAAQLFSSPDGAPIFLILAWAWPVLILSKLGCREAYFDTRQIVFSAPRPLANQLPAIWLSAVAVLALLGSGALLRFIAAGETHSLLGWFTGLVFVPSLALLSGVLTGSSKTFEALYVLWMYLLSQRARPFDFLGLTPESPLAFYALLALVLLGATVFIRRQQLIRR